MINTFNIIKNNIINESIILNKKESVELYKKKNFYFFFYKLKTIKNFRLNLKKLDKKLDKNLINICKIKAYQYPIFNEIKLNKEGYNIFIDENSIIDTVDSGINDFFIFLIIIEK